MGFIVKNPCQCQFKKTAWREKKLNSMSKNLIFLGHWVFWKVYYKKVHASKLDTPRLKSMIFSFKMRYYPAFYVVIKWPPQCVFIIPCVMGHPVDYTEIVATAWNEIQFSGLPGKGPWNCCWKAVVVKAFSILCRYREKRQRASYAMLSYIV
jgi:hypothetical protein